MRCELADYERVAIKPMLPNKPRGVPPVNDRRFLNGIFWVCDPQPLGATCPRHLVRTPRATTASLGGGRRLSGGRIIDALSAAHDAAVQMTDTTIVRAH